MKKTKFDDYVFYDPKQNDLWHFCWDHRINKDETWFGYNGQKVFHPIGKFKDVVPKRWVLIDRLPEKTL